MKDKNYKDRMLHLWDAEKNKKLLNIDFSEINTKDIETQAYWICDFEGRQCSFIKTPKQVYQSIYNGAAVCNICRELPYEKSIMFKAPHRVEQYWDHKKNTEINVYPNYKPGSSNDSIYVHCIEHSWKGMQRCADLAKHIPCPFCNGKGATPDWNLQILFPEIAKTLHPDYDPTTILPYSSIVYPWWCDECKDFYKKSVSCRTEQNQGCPNHSLTSLTEQLICSVLNEIIGGFEKYRLKTKRWSSNGNPVEIDIYHNKLEGAIEYDGKHHDTKVREISDQEKNNMLYKSGEISFFIRIREENLPKLAYYEKQHEVICGKHEYTYKFLIKPLQEVLSIMKDKYNIYFEEYTDDEVYGLITELLPKISRNDTPSSKSKQISVIAPGLLRHIPDDKKHLSYGSNIPLESTCPKPDCRHKFRKIVKNLVKSKGLCPKCLFFVKDILDADSPLVRWHPKKNTL
ncbi:MAG: zinc-ribbon domain-containing protein [Anaerobacillus sp.]|uniref:zinc-ribbon domain-containing protein n=1 Tax=Anaerobacillus sp. TaxID=1872506 RepID=UPI00391AB7C3